MKKLGRLVILLLLTVSMLLVIAPPAIANHEVCNPIACQSTREFTPSPYTLRSYAYGLTGQPFVYGSWTAVYVAKNGGWQAVAAKDCYNEFACSASTYTYTNYSCGNILGFTHYSFDGINYYDMWSYAC